MAHRLQCKTQHFSKHKFPIHVTRNIQTQLKSTAFMYTCPFPLCSYKTKDTSGPAILFLIEKLEHSVLYREIGAFCSVYREIFKNFFKKFQPYIPQL